MLREGLVFAILCALLSSGCGGGGGGGDSSSSEGPDNAPKTIAGDGVACAPTGAVISISGTISFERPSFSSTLSAGLDYNNIQTLPVRGADLQALGTADCVIASVVTSSTGTYTVNVDTNSDVKIRVKARTESAVGATWNFEVRDNTNANGLYVLDGSLITSGTTNSVRNLTATTGWTGSSYGGPRASAPFSILDSVYDSLQTLVAADAAATMDPADIFWSINNSTASGTLSNGEIGSSFYSADQIYVLGAENSDTDEFDIHVLAHEFGHYFEDNLSRADSVGGSHLITSKLDPRVALSEGFGNAFAGIVTGDPLYRDSSGSGQSSDFQINVESNSATNIGWFNEGSVQTILYDVFDSVADANDSLSLGFLPIYTTMTSLAYRNQSSESTIFSWVDIFLLTNAGSTAAMSTLVTSQGIDTVTDSFGTGESNNGGDANDLPVYKLITDNGVPVMVCSSKANGEQNRLGNRQFMRVTSTTATTKTITATRISGLSSSDPDLRLHLNGNTISTASSSVANTESINRSFNIDEYILEVYEFTNIDNSASTGGDVCFNVTFT